MNLDSIKVLWLQPDTLALWGIPYEMRADCGQQPYDLWKAHCDFVEPRPGHYGSERIKLDDWVYLGSPGWWSGENLDDRAAALAFLETFKDQVPRHPCEWTTLVRASAAPEPV